MKWKLSYLFILFWMLSILSLFQHRFQVPVLGPVNEERNLGTRITIWVLREFIFSFSIFCFVAVATDARIICPCWYTVTFALACLKSWSVTIQKRATEKYFPVVMFIMLYKVVLTFESVDEILKCDHSIESYWAVLSCGTVYYAVQGDSNFWPSEWNPHHLFRLN